MTPDIHDTVRHLYAALTAIQATDDTTRGIIDAATTRAERDAETLGFRLDTADPCATAPRRAG